MTLVPIEIPPGVVDVPTKTSKSSNWSEANLIRWVGNKLFPVGGWEKLGYGVFASPLRAIHTWTTNAGVQITAYICMGHVYVDRGGAALEDISPVTPIAQPSLTVVGGFGDNKFNFSTYGTSRPARTDMKPITPGYYVDNWGQNLLVTTSTDGRLLMWDPSVANAKLTAVANAPTANRAFVVTPQRHVMLFGAGGQFNRFAWCHQEDINNWVYADVTKSAGFYDIQPAAMIVTASRAGDDVIFWTANGDTYAINYIGMPYVFAYELIGSGAVPVSPMSVKETAAGTVWISSNGPWRYESRSQAPVTCPVWPWVIEKVNGDYARYNASMVPIDTYSEIWWFFPEVGSQKNTHYIQWNYKEGWWSQGKLSRSCGASSTYTDYPLMATDDKVFRHEKGNFYADVDDEDLPWAKTFNINAGGGSILSTFMRLLPDVDGDVSGLTFELEYNIPRAGSGVMTRQKSGRKTMLADGFVPFRDTGRDFRMTVKQARQGVAPWNLGEHQVDIVPRGGK